MVSTLRYIFFFPLLFLMGCGKPQFTLDFSLSEDVTENFSVTYYAADSRGGLTVQAVASVRDGKCELNGMTKLPTIVDVTTRRSNFPLVIYAKMGDKIEITGQGKEPLAWEVEGDDINKELSAWRTENLNFLLENNTDSVNLGVRKYVERKRGNPVSTILMLSYFNRNADPRGYAELMASLTGEARGEVWLHTLARADQQYSRYAYPAKLKSLVMRSVKDGADTISTDGKNPVMLLFWQTGYPERKNMVDSLKALKKEFPDSVRLVADVCLDIDSTGWRNAIRRDTLDFIKRFWAPTSLSDPTVMKFKVTAIPYFIVFDSSGNQSYRGNNLGDAIADFRRLHNTKDSINQE